MTDRRHAPSRAVSVGGILVRFQNCFVGKNVHEIRDVGRSVGGSLRRVYIPPFPSIATVVGNCQLLIYWREAVSVQGSRSSPVQGYGFHARAMPCLKQD
jgi:hypothetical protein